MALKYTYLIVLSLFVVAFIVNFVFCLLKDAKVKKAIKANPQRISGTITEIKKVKSRIYILVEFTSEHNRLLFTETFEFFEGDIKEEDYQVGKTVEMLYKDVTEDKKIKSFPLLLSNLKIKLEKGPMFLNIALIVMGVFIFVQTLLTYIKLNAFTSDIPLFTTEAGGEAIYTSPLYLLLMLVVYIVVVNYMVTSLIEAPRKDIQNYLKIYGNVAKARVKTYKFSRNKDSKGNKESVIDLEFRTNEGVQVDAKLSSFLYTESQEEYIDIIYDPKNPKNIVYLKNN